MSLFRPFSKRGFLLEHCTKENGTPVMGQMEYKAIVVKLSSLQTKLQKVVKKIKNSKIYRMANENIG